MKIRRHTMPGLVPPPGPTGRPSGHQVAGEERVAARSAFAVPPPPTVLTGAFRLVAAAFKDAVRNPGGTLYSLVSRSWVCSLIGIIATAYGSTFTFRPAWLAIYRNASPNGIWFSVMVIRASDGLIAGAAMIGAAGIGVAAGGGTRSPLVVVVVVVHERDEQRHQVAVLLGVGQARETPRARR